MDGRRHEFHVSEGEDLTTAPRSVLLVSLLVLPIIAAFTLLPFCARWGIVPLLRAQMVLMDPVLLIGGLLVLGPVHEGLHALGYLLAGVPRGALRIGVHLRTCSMYVHCATPVRVEAYRIASVLPFLMLGLGPAILSWQTGSGWLALAAAFSIASATGDLLLLWNVRGVPADRWVADHPVRVGCRILARVPLRPAG